MKGTKITFWITTTIIFLLEGVLVALTSHTKMAQEGITHLGYPLYFVALLAVFKVLGTLALIIPKVPARIKEWAYAGFMIDFLSAFISIWVVDGINAQLILPVVMIVVLVLSYTSYHKLNSVVLS